MDRITPELLHAAHNECRGLSIYEDPRFPPSLYYRFFEAVARRAEPALSVELGTCGGGASLHLAKGYPRGHVVSFDVTREPTVRIVEERFPNFTFHQQDVIVGADLCTPASVLILFVDTTHTYEQTLREHVAWRPKMASGGVIFFDDLGREGMWPALRVIGGEQIHFSDLGGDGGMVALLIP